MRLVYLPATLPNTFDTLWARSPIHWLDARMHGTEGYHPYLLASFYHWGKERYAFEEGEFAFGDSGGFSALSLGAKIDPVAVIRWQLRAGCDIGCVLDTPPFTDPGAGTPRPPWEECLHRTVKATKQMLPIYLSALDSGHPFRLFGIVHGRTREQLFRWWDAISAVHSFTGWCLKPHPLNDPEAMALVLDFVREVGITRAHFFATSGRLAVETLAALGPGAGLEWASFDSTTPIMRGISREIRVPGKYGRPMWLAERHRDTGGKDTKVRHYMTHECNCASCSFIAEDLQTAPALVDEEYIKYRCCFHNVIAYVREFREIEQTYSPRLA